jgi:nicotinamidase-related amidase
MTDTTTLPSFEPQHAALMVMDFQPGIIQNVSDADALLTRVAGAIALARTRGVHIGYVRVAFDDADFAKVPPTNKSFSRITAGATAFRAEAPETAVHQRVAPEAGDIVVRKTRVGAFSTTDLDRQLRARGVDTLFLAGISTSGVVLSTIRDAADRDYRLFVLVDGCADTDAEVHEVLTTKVFPRQADVITIADFHGLLTTQ